MLPRTARIRDLTVQRLQRVTENAKDTGMARDDQKVFLVLGYEEVIELFSRSLECQEADTNASISALHKLARALDWFGTEAQIAA